jgi:hypothetical protein
MTRALLLIFFRSSPADCGPLQPRLDLPAASPTTGARPRPRPDRNWASGRELDRIERLAFAYRAQLAHASLLRILPVALDANVVLNAVARGATGKSTELIDAARLGLIRLYVGETVPSEVERNLAWRAQKAGVPVELLTERWADIRPLLRVVDTGLLEHPGLARILERHPADRPTAVLSLFIGARLTWSTDHDLRQEGYADRLRVEVILAAESVGQFDLNAHLALIISSESIAGAGRAVMRAIDHPGTERTVAIVVLLLAAGALTVALVKDAERVKQTAVSVAAHGIEAWQGLAMYRTEEGQKLPAIPVPAASESLAVRIAHALAVAPAPLTTTELAEIFSSTGAPAAPLQIEKTLVMHRMFVPGRHGWQLGAW